MRMGALGSGDKPGGGLQNGGCFRKGREDGGNLLYMISYIWSFGFKTTI
jgi:hypothetical protein